MKKMDFPEFLTAMNSETHKDEKMQIFHHDLNLSVESDRFSLGLLNDAMPDWLNDELRKDMVNSLKGFTDEVALEIVDNLIDCWTGLGLPLTGIGHVDTMLWDFYWRILDCAHTKGIKIEKTISRKEPPLGIRLQGRLYIN